jgi:type I restriction enzyme S subunit
MKMVTKWKTLKVADLGRVVTGKTPPTGRTELMGDVYPFITPTDIGDYRDCTPVRHLSEEGRTSQRNLLLPAKTVCVTCIASVGKMCMTSSPSFTNQQINSIIVNEEKHDPSFVYYLLKTRVEHLKAIAGGAATPIINKSSFSEVEVRVPELPTQRKIAGILSVYDDLIENNLSRIKILEEMAQSLYREWFVHFRFPGHESTKFVDSALGQIPKGWGITDLEKVTTKIGSGATPRGGKDSYQTDGITLIRSMNIYDYSFEFDNLAFIDPKQAAQLENVSVEARDVLLNITGASVCRCAMVPSYLLPARVNQHVAIIRANIDLMDPHFLLDSINSEQNKRTLFSLAQGGATREALTKETICRFKILLPPRDLVFRYGRIADAMHTQREGLQRKSQVLRRTRDLLLPQLLQGKT